MKEIAHFVLHTYNIHDGYECCVYRFLDFWFEVQLTDERKTNGMKQINKTKTNIIFLFKIQDSRSKSENFCFWYPFRFCRLYANRRICKICIMHCGSEKWDRDDNRIRKKNYVQPNLQEKSAHSYTSYI